MAPGLHARHAPARTYLSKDGTIPPSGNDDSRTSVAELLQC
jgi:hypothetical protein